MITNEMIANNIRAERNRLHLSQLETAKLLGISRDVYTNVESNRKIISAMMLYRLSNIFNCKVDAFFVQVIPTKCGE